ncbi:hypothetical protein HU200_027931 [Digitaria exilis]|uniref:Uncharacterized protein n=1 Tax=Digitaria exilis TaxID=1010633 RepID=A0A835BW85_9POAL|nr:hypothetical protein HU200_027931 [Digitaria exilis]
MEIDVAAAEAGVGEDAAPAPADEGDALAVLKLFRRDAEEDLGDEVLRQIGERRAAATVLCVLGGGGGAAGWLRRTMPPWSPTSMRSHEWKMGRRRYGALGPWVLGSVRTEMRLYIALYLFRQQVQRK